MREFTLEDLAKYDGKEGRPAYVAYKEKVYDVSESFLWKDGEHMVMHQAGKDLTEELDTYAPHGPEMLERFPVVGVLKKE